MIKSFLSAMLLVVLISSCQQSLTAPSIRSQNLHISISKACGWCAPGDSLTVSQQLIYYKYLPSSCSKDGKIISGATSQDDWDELMRLLEIEKFTAIRLSECNICVDGCDEWITIRQRNDAHTIRYGSIENEKLKPIRPFIEKLRNIRSAMSTKIPEAASHP